MSTATSTKRAAVLAAFNKAAVAAVGVHLTEWTDINGDTQPADVSVEGLAILSTSAARSAARLCLSLFMWEHSTGDNKADRTARRAEAIEATGLSKGTVSNYYRAGEILSRIGERSGEDAVMKAAAAVCSKRNAAETATAFGGKTGGPLAVAILKDDAVIKAAVRAARGPAKKPDAAGTDAATAENNKRPVTRVIADAAHEISKIDAAAVASVKGKAEIDALNGAIRSLVAEALRIAQAAGIDAADILSADTIPATGTDG